MRSLLSFFKKTPKQPENFIALDFGTTSTKCFIFSLPAACLPARQGRQVLNEQVQLLGQGQGTPEGAVEQAVAEAGLRPTQAVVGIGGENVWCLTTTIRFNRPDPEKEIGPQEVERLNDQIFRTALMQATPQMSQFLGDPELTLQLIDSEILYYKLDGKIYPLASSPAGEVGRALESSIFTAYSPTGYLGQLSETLKELNLNLWAVTSLMSVLVKTLANNDPLNFNAIILDIGGKITDAAVVFGGGIWGTRPLLLGGETFTTAISSEEKKIAYVNHQLRDEEVLEVKEKLEPALDLWLRGIEATLLDFEGIKTFPSRMILTGGGAMLGELKEGLTSYPLVRALPFTSPPVVEVRTDVGPQNMKLVAKDILSEGP